MKFLIRLFKIFLRTALVVVGIIIWTLLSFWIELKISKTLPTPTGKYQVGRMNLHLTDTTRLDSLSPQPFSKRELMVWIWYPAAESDSSSTVDYVPKEWSEALNEKRGFLMNSLFARDASKIHAHSFHDAKISDEQINYPVLLMKSGIGTMATDYTSIAEELASHGYIVVGSDTPYSTWLLRFPDGRLVSRTYEGNPGESATISGGSNRILNRLVQIWSDDAHFVLNYLEQLNTSESSNQFFNKLNLNSVGVFGHSFGGATAAQFCLNDPRCKAGVDMDGAPYGTVIKTGLNKPFMFLLADHSNETDSVSVHIKSNIEEIYHSLPENHYWIYLEDAQHFNFSDLPFQKELLISRLSGATGSIGGKRGLEMISSCLLSFFDKYLKDQTSTQINDLSKRFPEIKFAK
jgi:predicted dienelactone hydrolase